MLSVSTIDRVTIHAYVPVHFTVANLSTWTCNINGEGKHLNITEKKELREKRHECSFVR